MDEMNFRAYMKQHKKPARTTDGYVKSVGFYAGYLGSHQQVDTPEGAKPWRSPGCGYDGKISA